MRPRGPVSQRAAAALVAALAAPAACGGGAGGRADSDGGPLACDECWCGPQAGAPPLEVALGRADGADFVPITDGDELDVHAGPQGGHHFLVLVKARALDLESAQTLLSASLDAVDVDALSCPYRTAYVPGSDGWSIIAAQAALVLDEEWVESGAAEGARVTVRAEVQDGRGAYGAVERAVVAHVLPLPGAGADAGMADASAADAAAADGGVCDDAAMSQTASE